MKTTTTYPGVKMAISQDGGRVLFTMTTPEGDVREFRTNPNGEGLFGWSEGRNEWVQMSGTCQFSANCSRSAQRRRALARCADQWAETRNEYGDLI
jgi:hypothetical protein